MAVLFYIPVFIIFEILRLVYITIYILLILTVTRFYILSDQQYFRGIAVLVDALE